MPGPESAPNALTSISVWAQSSMEMQGKQLKKDCPTPRRSRQTASWSKPTKCQMQTKCTAMKPHFSALCGTHLDPLPGSSTPGSAFTPDQRRRHQRPHSARCCGHTNTRERWPGSRTRAGTFDVIMLVASTLIGTMAGAYKPGNCAAAR